MIKQAILLCILPLLLGIVIYIFFRDQGILGISARLSNDKPYPFVKPIINTLPDFCWAFSLSNTLYLFFKISSVSLKRSTIFIILSVALSEIVQIFFPKHFTFDWLDLLADLIACSISLICMQTNFYDKKKV